LHYKYWLRLPCQGVCDFTQQVISYETLHLPLAMTAALLLSGVAIGQSKDPAPGPGTHVETTVVGDAREDNPADLNDGSGLDNDHHLKPVRRTCRDGQVP